MPADGTSLPVTTNGDTGTSRLHGSSWTVAPSGENYIRGVVRPEDCWRKPAIHVQARSTRGPC